MSKKPTTLELAEQKPERPKVVSVSIPPKKQAEFYAALATLKRHHEDPFIQQAPLIVETIIEAARRLREEADQKTQESERDEEKDALNPMGRPISHIFVNSRRYTQDERTGGMNNQPNFVTSPFDAIRHLDGEREFWRARELHKLLGYDRWENFEKVIAKAKVACKYNGRDVDVNFRETTKTRRVGSKGGKTDIRDVERGTFLRRSASLSFLMSHHDRKVSTTSKNDLSFLQTEEIMPEIVSAC